MIGLEKEAEEYYNIVVDSTNIPREHYEWEIIQLMADFAGSSKYVEQKILEAQIAVIKSLFDLGLKDVHQTMNTPKKMCNDVISPLISRLEKELKLITKK